jgi:hypothetical protein
MGMRNSDTHAGVAATSQGVRSSPFSLQHGALRLAERLGALKRTTRLLGNGLPVHAGRRKPPCNENVHACFRGLPHGQLVTFLSGHLCVRKQGVRARYAKSEPHYTARNHRAVE